MARLAIRQLRYSGVRYKYESPRLGDGFVIIEGENGAGKSTFANLVYFGLGGRVEEFQSKSRTKHPEIVGDERNFVTLDIEIDDRSFTLKRYIGENDIGVSDGTAHQLLPLYRGEGRQRIFSDWILTELKIDPVKLQFGTYSGMINFNHLCRLIYHNQAPDPAGIYKTVDDASFVSDSRTFRRAIFELLIGKQFQEYYSVLAEYRASEQERNSANQALKLFEEMAGASLNADSESLLRTRDELKELREQAARLLKYRGELAKSPPPVDVALDLAKSQEELIELQLAVGDLKRTETMLLNELAGIERTKADLVMEATQIQKMIFSNEQLALFDSDTCPYCLHPVERAKNKCICGHDVDEGEYVKFFYNDEEYTKILKSKQKNVQTLSNAATAVATGMQETRDALLAMNERAKELNGTLRKMSANLTPTLDLKAFEEAESKLNLVRDRIRLLEQVEDLGDRRLQLEERLEKIKERASALRLKAHKLEAAADKDMENQRSTFATKYSEMMREVISGVTHASIDSDYMPVLNAGEYKQASASVARRLLYFTTLLHMSLTEADVKYPRFLLIDTPDTAGIDDDNLVAGIEQLAKVVSESPVKSQVIFTTGVGKYPSALGSEVIARLQDVDGMRLLQPVGDNLQSS